MCIGPHLPNSVGKKVGPFEGLASRLECESLVKLQAYLHESCIPSVPYMAGDSKTFEPVAQDEESLPIPPATNTLPPVSAEDAPSSSSSASTAPPASSRVGFRSQVTHCSENDGEICVFLTRDGDCSTQLEVKIHADTFKGAWGKYALKKPDMTVLFAPGDKVQR
mgnify:CR=1 FL=1